MKGKTAILAISTLSSLGILAAGLVYTPYSVEGVYNTGDTFRCMCDCKHYFRLMNGVVTIYSPGHNEASVLGPYKVCDDGRVKVYVSSFDSTKPAKHIFTVDSSYLGRSKITIADSDEKHNLIRCFPIGNANNAINNLEVEDVFLLEDQIVTVFYDKNHEELRREHKPIPNK